MICFPQHCFFLSSYPLYFLFLDSAKRYIVLSPLVQYDGEVDKTLEGKIQIIRTKNSNQMSLYCDLRKVLFIQIYKLSFPLDTQHSAFLGSAKIIPTNTYSHQNLFWQTFFWQTFSSCKKLFYLFYFLYLVNWTMGKTMRDKGSVF